MGSALCATDFQITHTRAINRRVCHFGTLFVILTYPTRHDLTLGHTMAWLGLRSLRSLRSLPTSHLMGPRSTGST